MRGATCLRRATALCALSRPPSSTILLRSILPPAPSPSPSSSSASVRCAPPRRALHSSTPPRPNKPQPRANASPPSSSPTDNDDPPNDPSTTSTRKPTPRGYTTQRDIDRSGRARPPWDHEITDPLIMVIDNAVAEGPLSTRYVLTKLEPGESLRMIQPYVPEDAQEARAAQYAVCKIVNKKDEYERQRQVRERKRAAAQQKPKTKELEMTWAIGGNDLLVKMGRLRSFLDKGMKVELTIGRKKGGRRVGEEEAGEVLRRVREEMEGSGAREGKAATGQIGGTMRLYLEGVARR